MRKVRTHYDNLKVARDAPPEVIRAAYKSLAQKYHPDRNPGNERAARIMKLVNTSYEVLSDPEQRARHDKWIAEQESPVHSEERPSNEEHSEPPAGSPAEQRAYYETGQVRSASHYERYWFVYLSLVVLIGGWLLLEHHRQDDFEIVRPAAPKPDLSPGSDAKKAEPRSKKKKAIVQHEPTPADQYEPGDTEPNPVPRDQPRPPLTPAPAPRDNSTTSYALQLSREIGKDQTYPSRAQLLGWQGTAEVLVRIGVDANIKDVSIAQSSGYDLLDEEAMQKVRRAKALPAPPVGFEGREFTVLVPIVFKLD